ATVGKVILVLLVIAAGIVGVVLWGNGTLQAWFGGSSGGESRQVLVGRLKKVGAASGEVQISLFWFNKKDLDLHVVCPSGEKIYYSHRTSRCCGTLDKDMNACPYEQASATPVENVVWPQGKAPRGVYKIYVNHFSRHDKADCRDPSRF